MELSTKISVIVPSYNQGRFIENVILSTINQTYQNWELMIQDGASKDNTADVCNKYCKIDKRIKFFSEKDKGYADAVNKALDKVCGELCVIQSSDDFFAYNNVFTDVIDIYSKNKTLTLIAGASVVVDENLNGLKLDERLGKYVPFENVYLLKDHFSQGATFFSRKRALDIGKLDSNVDMVADTDFWVRMVCSSPTSINSIYQTSKIWGSVVVQEEQRSMDLSNFYLGRAKMAMLHMDNHALNFDINWKKTHALNLIYNGISHFKMIGKDPSPFYPLFENVTGTVYREEVATKIRTRDRVKMFVKRILSDNTQPKGVIYNSKMDYVKNNLEYNPLSNYKWF